MLKTSMVIIKTHFDNIPSIKVANPASRQRPVESFSRHPKADGWTDIDR
jgi:hypothetical protein